jgi:CelD/BcsL family acetyltransferase involved in cellulose biosynthesis
LHRCPTLDISLSWSDYLATRSAKLRKNLRNSQRRLESLGTLTLARYQTPQEVARGLEVLLEVGARSWKQEARLGLGQSKEYRDFYRAFVTGRAAIGAARVYALLLNGKPIAATIAFTQGSTYYSAQIVHDAQYDSHSPGTLLESMELQELMQEQRFKTYDFLGAALANKRRWTDTMTDTNRALLLGAGLRSRLFDAYYFGIKPTMVTIKTAIAVNREPNTR